MPYQPEIVAAMRGSLGESLADAITAGVAAGVAPLTNEQKALQAGCWAMQFRKEDLSDVLGVLTAAPHNLDADDVFAAVDGVLNPPAPVVPTAAEVAALIPAPVGTTKTQKVVGVVYAVLTVLFFAGLTWGLNVVNEKANNPNVENITKSVRDDLRVDNPDNKSFATDLVNMTGLKGKDGVNGKDGTNGKDGKDGKDGAVGPAGKDGKDMDPAVVKAEIKKIGPALVKAMAEPFVTAAKNAADRAVDAKDEARKAAKLKPDPKSLDEMLKADARKLDSMVKGK